MKRLFDLFLAIIFLLILLIPMIVIAITLWFLTGAPILYWSDRVGKDNKIFKMPKFRSMVIDAPEVATHLLKNPDSYMSPIGSFLRNTSLDELPQIFSVLKGDMSFVGPRPALYNQIDLIEMRTVRDIHKLLPGITGLAQVNGRDELLIFRKVEFDEEYLNQQSFFFDIKILIMTILDVAKVKEQVSKMLKLKLIILRLSKISRTSKQLIMMLADYVLISLILSISLGNVFINMNTNLIIFSLPLVGIFIFAKFGLYRVIVHYIGFHAMWNVMQAVTLFIVTLAIINLMIDIERISLQSLFIGWTLILISMSGLRILARLAFDTSFRFEVMSGDIRKNVLVYGAGDAGIQLTSALTYSQKYKSVGFIDDLKELQGNIIRGVNVYPIGRIGEIISRYKVSEVLIAMPSITKNQRASIIKKLDQYNVVVRILPGMTELIEGKIDISSLRYVNIRDLLGRNIAVPNKELMGKNITEKVVVVTGAGGSIGSELCRQIVFLKPKILILYEMNELALYTIEKEISSIVAPLIDVYPFLGSVNNKSRISKVFKLFNVDTVYHAAAYKHVPIVEFNNSEGVSNNIFGTLNCAQAALDASVETFVLVSSDKAVRPTSTMGATKRSAEMVLQALADKQSSTRFSIVRFGNVLDSSGSVIPLFKKQIKEGGPVTVTSKNIVRYFMTIPEAVELVIQAGSMSSGGDIFVLDMGEPVRINDLAEKMIRLSGLEVKDEFNVDGDIDIVYTGLRPGEKLYEELLIGGKVTETDNPLIMRAEEDRLTWDELEPVLVSMRDAIDSDDQKKLRQLLIQLVPGFKPQNEIFDILYNGPK
jgi:FlaA1/EpsC-like NDP-sugar epimerase/lipopolysaccharide/colanic/teichoic acid biosynthesis glycosyltransferase